MKLKQIIFQKENMNNEVNKKLVKEFIDSETTQKGADLISKVGIKTFLIGNDIKFSDIKNIIEKEIKQS